MKLDPGQQPDLAADHPDFAVTDTSSGGSTAATAARFTARQWRRFQRDRKRWGRRALAATGAVVLAEVACALAWTAWAGALSTPLPKSPAA